MKHLILVDGHSLAYRMYFALERTNMQTSQKVPTWGVYGFFKALFDLLKQVEPDGMAVAFDVGRETFRTEMYPEYKAHRKAMPDSLKLQMHKIREGVELLGIPIFEVPNFEADDLIGTLAKQAAQKGVYVEILTGDQDAFQIIDPEARISVLLPSFKGGLSLYNRDKVFEKLGIYPEQVTDFKGLKGDTSDNIPGVPGIGDKTAAKLLTEYQTLENVLDHVNEISGNKVRQSLIDFREQAILSKTLACIRFDAPVEFTEDACHLRIPDVDDFLKFLADMEFRSFITQSPSLLKPFLMHQSLAVQQELAAQLPQSENGGKQLQLLGGSAVAVMEADSDPAMSFPFSIDTPGNLQDYEVPHQVVKDRATLEAFLSQIRQTNVFAVDIETSGLDFMTNTFAGISLSWTPGLQVLRKPPQNYLNLKEYPKEITVLSVDPEAVKTIHTIYVPVGHADCTDGLTPEEALSLLKPLLEDPDVVKMGHNLKFESTTFRHHGVHFQGLLFDTMVTSYVLNPDRRHALKSLVYEVLGHRMKEITELIGKGKSQKSFTEVPVDEAASYSACDAHVVIELAARFIPQLGTELESLLYEIELPLIEVLAEMEFNGVSLDTHYLKTLSVNLDERLKIVEQDIYAMAGVTFNLNSPKQVGEVLFERLQIPARGKTPTKSGYTTNAKVIESLAPDYPIVQKLLDYRQLFKLKSTYIDTLPALISPVDNRLHTSYNQTVAATGRLSSSNPNLQNIPIRSDLGRSIRQAFVPADRTNAFILSADYSQIELRLLAHFSEDPSFLHAFQSGEDIHKATAALIFDVPLDQVAKDMRYRAKAVNFGIIYGQTAFGLSNALKIPPKEAADFIAKYFTRYPKVRSYIDVSKTQLHQTATAKTIGGRVRDFSEGLNNSVRNIREFTERAAFNMPLQGSAADIVKAAMIRLYRALKREKLRSKLILQVHDEVVLEVLHEERDRVCELVNWAMTLDQPLKVPLDIDISEGPTWMEVE